MENDKLKEWATNRFDKDSEIQRLNTNLEMLQKMRYSYGDMAHKHNMDKEYYLDIAQKIADKKMNISELYYDYLEHFRTDRTGLINRSPEERHLHEQLRDGYKILLDYLSDLLQAVETKSKLAPSRKQTEKPITQKKEISLDGFFNHDKMLLEARRRAEREFRKIVKVGIERQDALKLVDLVNKYIDEGKIKFIGNTYGMANFIRSIGVDVETKKGYNFYSTFKDNLTK